MEQLVTDMEQLQERVNSAKTSQLPEEQFVWDSGTAGPFVDATAPTTTDRWGWGVVMGNAFARGVWNEQITGLCK